MKKKLLSILIVSTMALALGGCGSNSDSTSKTNSASQETDSTSQETEQVIEKEYIDESQISDLFTNADDFKGKYVTLTGQVISDPETNGDEAAIQVFYDTTNYDKSYIVYYSSDISVSANDYVIIDGEITGSFTGENYFGSEITCPLIEADTVTISSYLDIVVPTISEITPENASAEQHNIVLQIDKVEFAEAETRIYLTLTNNSSDSFEMYSSSMLTVQNGTQYEYNWDSYTTSEAGLNELTDTILPGATSSGVVIFPALDSSTSFQLYAEGYSDNWELEFDYFVIEIQPAE